MNSIPQRIRVLFVLLLGLIFLPRTVQAQSFPGTGAQANRVCEGIQGTILARVDRIRVQAGVAQRARALLHELEMENKFRKIYDIPPTTTVGYGESEAQLKQAQTEAEKMISDDRSELERLLGELAKCNCPEKTSTRPTEEKTPPGTTPIGGVLPGLTLPRAEISVGVQYQHAPKEPAQNLVGIDGQASYNFAKRIGIVADVAWTTGSDRIGTSTDVRVDRFTVLGGPKIKTKLFFFDRNSRGPSQGRGIELFFQPLFGLVHDTTKFQSSTISTSSASTAFMGSVGGGTEVMFKKNVGVRSEVDYQLTHFGGFWQNNIRIAAGIVFRFGKEKELPTW